MSVARLSLIAGIAVSSVVCLPLQAANFDVLPGQKLDINFDLSAPPTTPIGPVDFIEFNSGLSYVDFSNSSYIDVSLYNGNTLLGTDQLSILTNPGCGCVFVSPGSPGETAITVPIDMSSIVNGTIDGTITVVPHFEQPDSDSAIELGWTTTPLSVGSFISFNQYYSGTPAPNVLNAEVSPVPEPSPGVLFCGGLAALISALWIRRPATRLAG